MTAAHSGSSMTTGTDTQSVHVEDGERVFPCRCGVTHRGQYAFEDWMHHECLHDATLVPVAGPDIFMCPDCGRVFQVEVPSGG